MCAKGHQWSVRTVLLSGFCSIKRLGVFLLSPVCDAGPSQGYPSALNCYTPKCLAQEHNAMSPGRVRTRIRSPAC